VKFIKYLTNLDVIHNKVLYVLCWVQFSPVVELHFVIV